VRGQLFTDFSLTRRQVDVLEQLTLGRESRDIAAALHLSTRSVDDHVRDLHIIMGTHDRAALVSIWLEVLYAAIDSI
jgi:DNA-binding NarL/FixJ family response regulator